MAVLVAEVGVDEFLEVAALFAFGLGGGAVFGEDRLQRGGRHGGDESGSSLVWQGKRLGKEGWVRFLAGVGLVFCRFPG